MKITIATAETGFNGYNNRKQQDCWTLIFYFNDVTYRIVTCEFITNIPMIL